MKASAPLRLAADSEPIASLGMYDLPGLSRANDILWSAIAAELRRMGFNAPDQLTRDSELDAIWRNPNLMLAQTCGYPLTTRLKGLVQVVATPRYRAPGCSGTDHRAAIIVAARRDLHSLAALRGARCAVNDRSSNTGMNLLRAKIAPLAEGGRFFDEIIVTRSHAASLMSVAQGAADVASIDAVSFALLGDLYPALAAAVRVLDWTDASPALPLVTAAATPPTGLAALRHALGAVAADPRLGPTRAALRLEGFSVLPDGAYDQVARLEQEADQRGYPQLA